MEGDGDGVPLTAAEKQQALDAVAAMIASTIDGANCADVHAALSAAQQSTENWREVVQQKIDARQRSSSSSCNNTNNTNTNIINGNGEAPVDDDKEFVMLSDVSLRTTTWECPKCGNKQSVVDVRSSLRHSSTSAAVHVLTDNNTSSCSICTGGDL
ncbi:uncharacterized protein TM35_000481280 [Trypanosoma theileri]|uniref:Uncharacterized protein n=1 Tax=Trypanosoma theileri TaxID=67003 RepID=A0A1X0NHN4_9TRYP|nr:uncharacterized protein TM35_000481280 [Trypanosoma theileri]ORC84167.1 hypothetical protein TM35_000481280 [Trypanosoma theileri]